MTSSPSAPIRILLLTSHTLARAGFKLLLESVAGFKVVAESGEGNEALQLAGQVQPDIILMEPNLSGAEGPCIISNLLAETEHARVLLITSDCAPNQHVQYVQMGAMGVVTLQQAPAVLFKAIEKIQAGEIWLDRSLVANALGQMARGRGEVRFNPEARKIALLSAREREIITQIGEGLKNIQIAERLFISEVTVRHHLTSIYKKLCVSDRLELILYAYRNGLAQPPD